MSSRFWLMRSCGLKLALGAAVLALGERMPAAPVAANAARPARGPVAEERGSAVPIEVHRQRAEQLFQSGRSAAALAEVERFLRGQPRDAMALALRGAIQLRLGQTALALASLNAALQFEPDLALALRWRAVAYHTLRQPARALADLERGLKRHPGDPDLLFARGHLRCLEGDFSGGLADLDEVVRQIDDPESRQVRAWALNRAGRRAEALRELDRVLAVRQTPEGLRLRGTLLLEMNRAPAAVADLRQMARLQPAKANIAQLLLWTAQIRSGQAEEARREMQAYAQRRVAANGDAWTAQLIRFAAGGLSEEQILQAARARSGQASPDGRRTESAFYAAMRRYGAGEAKAGASLLARAVREGEKHHIEHGLAVAFLR